MRQPSDEHGQTYAMAREPYRQKYPRAKMHHLIPTIRNGPDSEFNLFPWNEKSHAAWHMLFSVMTIREVWPILEDAHMLIFQSDEDEVVRDWCLPHRYHVTRDIQNDIAKAKSVAQLRDAWCVCFGSADLIQAFRLVRYMMLFMVFGRHADDSGEVYVNPQLRCMLRCLDGDAERSWAFRVCFGVMSERAPLRRVKRVIRRVRSFARTIPIR